MKKTFIGTVLLSSLLLGGCSFGFFSNATRIRYDDAGKYVPFNGQIAGIVTKLEINWIGGDVYVETGADLSITENADFTLTDELKLHYRLDGTTLKLQFARSGEKLDKQQLKKTLHVVVPASITELEVNTVSADAELKGLSLTELEVQTVSGNALITNVTAGDLDVKTVSGTAVLGGIMSNDGGIESVSGNIVMNQATMADLDVKSVSGDITASVSGKIRELDAETVSGKIEIKLPENLSFTAKVKKVGGKFDCAFPTTVNKNVYTYGDGRGVDMKLETVSGTIVIGKADGEV